MRKIIILGLMVLNSSIPASYALADQGGTHGHGKGTHMKVTGTVSAIESDLITVKTSWGQIRISSATAPKNLEVGEEVEMQVNENNAVIERPSERGSVPFPSICLRQADLCRKDEEGDQALDPGG